MDAVAQRYHAEKINENQKILGSLPNPGQPFFKKYRYICSYQKPQFAICRANYTYVGSNYSYYLSGHG
jgi:hypothetical protein